MPDQTKIFVRKWKFKNRKVRIDLFYWVLEIENFVHKSCICWKLKQDGRLAAAYFSHEYKYFDQHLPTVKNETTGYHDFSFIFLSHSAEKFRWGTLRCIKKFRVSKNFMHQRGGISRFSVENFCHTIPKNFVGEHFGVSENFVHRKILCIRSGYHVTPLKNFCLTVPKNFVGEHFGVSKNFGYRKILCIREGGYHVSPSKTFVTQYQKISLGNTSVFQKISCIAKFYA